MKHLLVYLYIFLLTLELFTTPVQGLSIGHARGCNQRYLKSQERRMRKSVSTPWKPDKHEKLRSITLVNCDCPTTIQHKVQGTVKCLPTDDDPEKWFVKVYRVPDTRPQRYILCSVKDETGEIQSEPPTNISMTDVNKEFKRCTLQCDNDWLILRCTPHTKICPRVSGKKCAIVFYTKFLQINEPGNLKSSVLSAIVQGEGPRNSAKK